MDRKKRKITVGRRGAKLNPLFEKSVTDWIKDTEENLNQQASAATDRKSLTKIGYRASLIIEDVEKSSRRVRQFSLKCGQSVRAILLHQDELHFLFVHPVTGEVNCSYPTSVFSAITQWLFTKITATLCYGDMVFPILYHSWETLTKLASEKGVPIPQEQYRKKQIFSIKGKSKKETLKILRSIATDLSTTALPQLNSPVYSYLPFPGDITLVLSDKTKFILHHEYFTFLLPNIISSSDPSLSNQEIISNYFSLLTTKYPSSKAWNIIFTYFYRSRLSFLNLESFDTLLDAFRIAKELRLCLLEEKLDAQLLSATLPHLDRLKALPPEEAPPKAFFTFCKNKIPSKHTFLSQASSGSHKDNCQCPNIIQELNQTKLFNLPVTLANGEETKLFPVQYFTVSDEISNEILETGKLDLSQFSKETVQLLIDQLGTPKSHEFILNDENMEIIKLCSYLAIPTLSSYFASPFISSLLSGSRHLELPLYLNQLDFKFLKHPITVNHIQRLVKYCDLAHLEELSFESCRFHQGHELELLSSLLTSLKKLKLSGCTNFKRSCIEEVSKHLSFLEEIYLRDCVGVTDLDIGHVIKNCPDLKVLDVSGCSSLNGSFLFDIKSFSYNLSKVYLVDLHHVTASQITKSFDSFSKITTFEALNIRSISNNLLQRLSKEANMLSSLSLSCSSKFPKPPRGFFNAFPMLEEFQVLGCSSITSTNVTKLFESSPRLQKIDLSHCINITDKAFMNPPKNLSRLHLNGLKKLNGDSLKSLFTHSPIKVLHLKKCCKIKRSRLLEALAYAKDLEELNLSFCPEVNDEVIKAIAKHCTRLKKLFIAKCNIKGDALAELLSSCPRLELLDIGSNLKITNQAFQAFCTPHPSLKHLGLAFLKRIHKSILMNAIRANPQLEVLSLNRCPQIDNEVLEVISKECQQITDLRLYKCKKVTCDGVGKLLKSTGSFLLKSIELRGIKAHQKDLVPLLNSKEYLRELYLTSLSLENRNILKMHTPELKIYTLTY